MKEIIKNNKIASQIVSNVTIGVFIALLLVFLLFAYVVWKASDFKNLIMGS